MSTAIRNPSQATKAAGRQKKAPKIRVDTIGRALGLKLRNEREARGISVRSFARTLGVSPSLVSQIERGLVMPSVGTLYGMGSELGLTLDYLFDQSPRGATARSKAGPSRPGVAGIHRGTGRKRIHLANGVYWDLLTPRSDDHAEFWRVKYDVGAASCPEDALVRHGGSEHGYILSGRLGIRIGSDTFELHAGDSVSFNSENPHRLWTIGKKPASAIWVVLNRSNDRRRKETTRPANKETSKRKELAGVE
jgi:mannose-6-phosphate isomerase-like protein (cupin superfamily)/DNA-binding XRE family transcriptional regulator